MTKAEIQFIRSLSDKRTRDEERLFIAEGDKLKKQFAAKGFDLEAVKKFNKEADKRFEAFRQKMKPITEN